MNAITRLQVQLRSAVHRRVLGLPTWLGSKLGGGPARVDLRLDDLEGGTLAQRPLGEWQSRVLDLFMAHGALPVTVIVLPGNPLLGEIVRFCHRLDVPVTVRTIGVDLSDRVACAIVDGGVRRVVVRAPTVAAMVALGEARTSRRARLDIEAEVDATAGLEDARQWVAAGADGVRVVAGWRGAPPEPWPLREVIASFQRTEPAVWRALTAMRADALGVPREAGRCGIGARVVLDAEGARSCPWKGGEAARKPAEDVGVWTALAGQRREIAACDRACWHPEAR